MSHAAAVGAAATGGEASGGGFGGYGGRVGRGEGMQRRDPVGRRYHVRTDDVFVQFPDQVSGCGAVQWSRVMLAEEAAAVAGARVFFCIGRRGDECISFLWMSLVRE